jgi:hypothetical protein
MPVRQCVLLCLGVYADAFLLARVNLSNGAYFVGIQTVCSQFSMANYKVMIN